MHPHSIPFSSCLTASADIRPVSPYVRLLKFLHLRRLSAVLIILTAAFTHCFQANAQSTWNGTTDNWSTVANWSPAIIPASNSSTVLIFGGGTSFTATNDIGNFSLNQLQFINTAGTATLAGVPTTNALDFVNSTGTAALASITLTGAGSATISAPVIWDGETAVSNSGSGALLFSGNQSYANGTKQSFVNSGTGSITIADGITYAAAGSNTGLVLNLINNNSATGSFNIGDVGALGNVTVNVGGTGTVRFAGSSADDLFSASAVLNVLAGATFDFNGNGEGMGAISGAGTIRQTLGVNVAANGYYVLSGKMTGTGTNAALTVSGSGHTLALTGATSDYSGPTTITAGRLIISANAPNGGAGITGALGNATTEVLVGNTSAALNASLMIDTAGVTIGRAIRLQSLNTGIATIGGLNTSGTVTYGGNVTLGTNSVAAKPLAIYSAKGGTVEFTGNLLRATSASGTTDTLTVTGGGTVALRGSNTFTGATTVNAGTLLLDYATNNGSKLSSSAALTLSSSGSLSLIGNNAASSTQTVTGLTLGNVAAPLGGGARIVVTSGTNQNATLNLGAITRNTGATVDFSTVATGTGVAALTTSTANNAAAILGTYATFNRNDWAVNDGAGNIAALAAGSYTTTFATGLHTSLSANTAQPSGGATTHTLRMTTAAALTFNATTPGTLTLESGGILVASTAGTTSIGSSTTRGTITPTTGELIVHQQSTAGTLTINSVISGTNVVKTGDGSLTFTAVNTYTGNTIINGGTVTATTATNLGAVTADVTINGGTLALPSGTLGTLNTANRVVTVGPAGATFNFAVVQSLEGSGLAGSGTLTLTGAGGIAVGSSASTFTGDIVINNGVVRMFSQQFGSVASITANSGGTYEVNDDSTGTFGANTTTGRILINGNGFGGNGAIRVTDQTTGSALVDPRTTLVNEVVLQTTSRIQVDNGTAAGSLSQLSITGNVTGPGSLVKSGAGVLVLSARDNTYAGSTAVEAGTLRLNLGNDRLPTNTSVTLGIGTASGVLQLNGFEQSLAGLTIAGTGTANSVTGGSATSTSLLDVNLTSGTQTFGGTLGGGAGVNNTHANNNLGFIKDGTGTIILSRANTFNGATTVNQGTLVLGNASALGSGGASLAAGTAGTTVNAGATLDINGQSAVQEVLTLNGTGVASAGALVNNSATAASIGSGVASLNFSAATATGWSVGASVTIDPPAVGTAASAAAQLGLGTGSLAITNGGSGFGVTPVVTVSGGSGAVVIASVGVTNATYTVTSNTTTYSVAPSVTLNGGATGVANLDGTGKVVSITVTNAGANFTTTPTATFTGGTVLVTGTAPTIAVNSTNFTVVGLNIINPGTGFTSVPTVTITGGTAATAVVNDGNFVLNGVTITSSGSGYTSAPAVSIIGGTATATANVTAISLGLDSSVGGSGALTLNPVISGSYGLTKVGAGTTTLAAINLYTGTTTVSGGTLQVGVGGIGSTGAGATIVGDGSNAIILAGSGTVEGTANVTNHVITSAALLKPGDSSGSVNGGMTFNGNLDLNNNSQTQLQLTTRTATAGDFGGNAIGSAGYLTYLANNVSLWDTAAVGDHDRLQINGTLTLGTNAAGLISIQNNGYVLNAQTGDVFDLLDWNNVILGSFNAGTTIRSGGTGGGDLDLPDLSSLGLSWDVRQFASNGILLVVVAPEPSRAMLCLGGVAALLLRRRRKA